MTKGEIKAFLLCPILPILFFSIGVIAYYLLPGMDSDNIKASFAISFSLAVIGFFLCYLCIIVIALPTYIFIRRNNRLRKSHTYVCSAMIGAVIIMFVGTLFGADEIGELLPATIIGIVLGLSSGMTFWYFLPKSLTKRSNATAVSGALT